MIMLLLFMLLLAISAVAHATALAAIDLPPEPYQEEVIEPWWTEDELHLLAAVISAEARGENFDGMLAVGQVIMNRYESGIWSESLTGTIRAKGQFATPYWNYGELELEAARAVLNGERYDENYTLLYFKVTKSTKSWYCRYAFHVGTHAFFGHPVEVGE